MKKPAQLTFLTIGLLLLTLAADALSILRAAEFSNSAAAVERRLAHATRLLASDRFEGRGPGTHGIDVAADLIADEMRQAGLDTDVFDGSPFQPFTITSSAKLGQSNGLHFVVPTESRKESAAAPSKENTKTPAKENEKTPAKGTSPSEKSDGAAPEPPLGSQTIDLQLGQDFNPLAIGGSGKFDLPLVFAGYGITAPEEDYDDYAGLDVDGKAVIVLRQEPQQNDPHGKFDGQKHTEHAPFRRKVSNAYQHGAAAVIFCTPQSEIDRRIGVQRKRWRAAIQRLAELDAKFSQTEASSLDELERRRRQVSDITKRIEQTGQKMREEYDPVLDFQLAGRDDQGRSIPIVHCRRAVVDRLLRAAGHKDLGALEKEIDEGPAPRSFELTGCHAVGETSVVREGLPVKNVIGVLEGKGPHADETIVIGAHYDHLGVRKGKKSPSDPSRGGENDKNKPGEEKPGDDKSGKNGPGEETPDKAKPREKDNIYNGADDNASGTSALLEVARQLAARPTPLPRRIVFVAFSGEERGLLGSAEYVRHPPYPLEKTVAMLNMDMVGRMKEDKLIVSGSGTTKQFEPWLDELSQSHGLKLTKNPSGFGPSDHATFYAKKIPVLHFFTGLHTDYHRTSDHFESINVEGMRKVTSLVVEMADKVATTNEPLDYIEVAGHGMMSGGPAADSGPRNPRPYFGCIPDYSEQVEGLKLSGVAGGGPAAKAGLEGGDVIVRFGESKIGGIEDFDGALRQHEAGDVVPVVVLRDGKRVTLKVTLAEPK